MINLFNDPQGQAIWNAAYGAHFASRIMNLGEEENYMQIASISASVANMAVTKLYEFRDKFNDDAGLVI